MDRQVVAKAPSSEQVVVAGSFTVNVTVPERLEMSPVGPPVIVTTGAVVSTVHDQVAGLGSVLPTESVARVVRCDPTATGTRIVEDVAEVIARRIVERQRALRAEVRITARWPMRRMTPVTGLPTQEMVSLIGIAAATEHGSRRVVGVEATGINACPCAQGLVAGRAAERLAEAGYAPGDIEQILELVPIATHNQRGRGTLLVGTASDVDAETLVDLVERSMSAPVFELLKRPDELFVVEHAHLQPRFVEDSVRVSLKSLLDEVPGLADEDFALSRQVNLETIHDHDVLAERWGTIGQLRGELAGSGGEGQTTLAEWLTS